MQGSSYPSAEFDDLAAFTEGTDALTANLPNEVAAEAEAIQRTIGADALALTDMGYGSAFSDFTAAIRSRLSFEVGSFLMPASTQSVVVLFATTRMITPTNRVVMLQPGGEESGAGMFAIGSGHQYTVESFNNPSGGTWNMGIAYRKYDRNGSYIFYYYNLTGLAYNIGHGLLESNIDTAVGNSTSCTVTRTTTTTGYKWGITLDESYDVVGSAYDAHAYSLTINGSGLTGYAAEAVYALDAQGDEQFAVDAITGYQFTARRRTTNNSEAAKNVRVRYLAFSIPD